MKHFIEYAPTSLAEITFACPAIKTDLMDYATGRTAGYLLLYGEPGAGKTAIAKTIAMQRTGADASIINCKNTKAGKLVASIENEVSYQFLCCDKPTVIVDEVDVLTTKQQGELVAKDWLIEKGATVIFITNFEKRVDKALRSRCGGGYEIHRLTPREALRDAHNLLVKAGVDVDEQWLLKELQSLLPTDGSKRVDWRVFGYYLDRIIRHNSPPHPQSIPVPTLKLVK